MKLLEESQKKNSFQTIVDSLEVESSIHQEKTKDVSAVKEKQKKEISSTSFLGEYFEIAEVHSLKKNNNEKEWSYDEWGF